MAHPHSLKILSILNYFQPQNRVIVWMRIDLFKIAHLIVLQALVIFFFFSCRFIVATFSYLFFTFFIFIFYFFHFYFTIFSIWNRWKSEPFYLSFVHFRLDIIILHGFKFILIIFVCAPLNIYPNFFSQMIPIIDTTNSTSTLERWNFQISLWKRLSFNASKFLWLSLYVSIFLLETCLR